MPIILLFWTAMVGFWYHRLAHCSLNLATCGRSLLPGGKLRNGRTTVEYPYVAYRGSRILGGRNAPRHGWPWMLQLLKRGQHVCGAALIHNRFALTAAHCVAAERANVYQVIAGGHERMAGRRLKVQRVFVHSLFDKHFRRSYDFALLQLENKLDMTNKVNTACLPSYAPPHGKSCVVTGWGKVSGGGAPSAVLQQVRLPVMRSSTCNDAFHYAGAVQHATMLCAGYERGGQDACQGDSGGPMVCVGPTGQWQLHGLVSWGQGCGLPRRPGVYSKVLAALAWIRTTVALHERD